MAGSALDVFTDFYNRTGPAILTGPDKFQVESVQHSYLLSRFMKGAGLGWLFQGGNKIRDEIMFDEQNTAEFILPNGTLAYTQPQVLTTWEANWRFLADHASYTDQDITLNVSSGMRSEARYMQYKNIKRKIDMRVVTSSVNKIENQYFVEPISANMEASGGEEPYSIPAFINEYTNGLFDNSGGAGTTVWTTVQGISPVTEPRWRNHYVTYTSTTVGSAANNILAAFDGAYLRVQYKVPKMIQEYHENFVHNSKFIACSMNGFNIYKRILRDSQDQFVTASRQDPEYNNPQYAGIDLEYVGALDNAILYPNEAETGLTKESSATNDVGENQGPRYYWISGQHLGPIWHEEEYLKKKATMRHPNQPFTTVVPYSSYYNNICRSRQRLCLVGPGGSQNLYNYDPPTF